MARVRGRGRGRGRGRNNNDTYRWVPVARADATPASEDSDPSDASSDSDSSDCTGSSSSSTDTNSCESGLPVDALHDSDGVYGDLGSDCLDENANFELRYEIVLNAHRYSTTHPSALCSWNNLVETPAPNTSSPSRRQSSHRINSESLHPSISHTESFFSAGIALDCEDMKAFITHWPHAFHLFYLTRFMGESALPLAGILIFLRHHGVEAAARILREWEKLSFDAEAYQSVMGSCPITKSTLLHALHFQVPTETFRILCHYCDDLSVFQESLVSTNICEALIADIVIGNVEPAKSERKNDTKDHNSSVDELEIKTLGYFEILLEETVRREQHFDANVTWLGQSARISQIYCEWESVERKSRFVPPELSPSQVKQFPILTMAAHFGNIDLSQRLLRLGALVTLDLDDELIPYDWKETYHLSPSCIELAYMRYLDGYHPCAKYQGDLDDEKEEKGIDEDNHTLKRNAKRKKARREMKQKKEKSLVKQLYLDLLKMYIARVDDVLALLEIFNDKDVRRSCMDIIGVPRVFEALLTANVESDEENEGFANGVLGIVRHLKSHQNPNDIRMVLGDSTKFRLLLHQIMIDSNFNVCQSLGSFLCHKCVAEYVTPELLAIMAEEWATAAKMLLFSTSDFAAGFTRAFFPYILKIAFRNIVAEAAKENEAVSNVNDERLTQENTLSGIWMLLRLAMDVIHSTVDDPERFAVMMEAYYSWSQIIHHKSELHRYSSCEEAVKALPLNEEFSEFVQKYASSVRRGGFGDEPQYLRKYMYFLQRKDCVAPLDMRLRSVVDRASHEVHRQSKKKDKHGHVSLTVNRMTVDDSSNKEEKEMEKAHPTNEGIMEFVMQQVLSFNGLEYHHQMEVEFVDEPGIGDGPVRELLSLLRQEVFDNQTLNLFTLSPDSRSYHVSVLTSIDQQRDLLLYYEFVGRILAFSIVRNCAFGVSLSNGILRRLLSQDITWRDAARYDENMFDSFEKMLSDNESPLPDLNFTVYDPISQVDIPLSKNGRNIFVTHENKEEYVNLCTQFRMTHGVQEQIDRFCRGFWAILPQNVLSECLTISELHESIRGPPNLDVDGFRQMVRYNGYSVQSAQIVWFWEYVSEMSHEDQCKLLLFWSGSSSPPLHGFNQDVYHDDDSTWTVAMSSIGIHSLPKASTCAYYLQLPPYPTKEHLVKKFTVALHHGCAGYHEE